VAVIFVEQPAGGFKLSFRSRTPQIDCNQLARQFGGGGHKAAAGASIQGPWPEAQQRVLDVVRSAMR
jgi:phosphoesterase RecJ-like protein